MAETASPPPSRNRERGRARFTARPLDPVAGQPLARQRIESGWWPILFLAPALILYGLFGLIPVLQTVWLSLHDQEGIGAAREFVGLGNYARMFEDSYFLQAFRNTIVWVVVMVAVVPTVATLLAVLLHSDSFFASLCKTAFFLPLSLSFSVIGIIWTWIYQPKVGLLDQGLRAMGLEGWIHQWLGPDLALYSLIIAAAWMQIAFSMIILLAGLSGIPKETLEAARIDGANETQVFWSVKLPLLKPAMAIVISSAIIFSLQSTEIVLTMTKGGPFGMTDVLGYRMYVESFWNYRFGYGAAIGVVISVLTAIIVLPYLTRVIRHQEKGM